jgi:hypothetical protein
MFLFLEHCTLPICLVLLIVLLALMLLALLLPVMALVALPRHHLPGQRGTRDQRDGASYRGRL